VNSPFQRFKRNLLLLLQVLLLTLLVIAAMQPFWRGRSARVRRIPVLMDCSASMAALDKPHGSSRIDAAKRMVREMIDGLLPDQQLCLISLSRTARKRSDFTNDKRVLREALDEIAVEDVPSDIEDALRMTQGLAQSTEFEKVFLFSDGNLPARAHFDLCFALDYQQLPPAGPNLGITSLNARRTAEGDWDVFVLVEGSAEAEGPATVELTQDAHVTATEHISVGRGKAERMVFQVQGGKPSSVTVSLSPSGFDSLSSDNVAFLDLPAVRPLQVYAPTSLGAYRHALSAFKDLGLHSEDDESGLHAAYDLVVTDRTGDFAIEGKTCCYVGLIPDDLQALVSVGQEGAGVVDWRRSSPLLQHVELGDLAILDEPRSHEGVSEHDYENLGYEVLIHGDRGPLLLQKRAGDRLLFYFLLHTDRSTLPYRIGFPVLVANLVQMAMDQAGLAEAHSIRSGVLPDLLVEPNRAYEIKGPDGRTRAAQSNEAGMLSGIPAPQVGYYTVFEGGHRWVQACLRRVKPLSRQPRRFSSMRTSP
jgi:hypothetical protein